MTIPFYDPEKSYEENYTEGPFGIFQDECIVETAVHRIVGGGAEAAHGHHEKDPSYDFLGVKVNIPFGIPAGPLLNAKFCRGAFCKGYDICVYKTVRSEVFSSHPWPNILSVKVTGDLTPEKAAVPLVADHNYVDPISITNSFGVPSKESAVWQSDVQEVLRDVREGQVLVLSFMGTVRPNQTSEEFIADYALAARLAVATGVKILETNLSCPNIGNEGLVCYNLDMTEKICEAIRKEIGDTPLILKVGYYKDEQDLRQLAAITSKYAQAIAVINTIQAEIVDENGKAALPGVNRTRSGVCGASIKWAGIEMVQKLTKIRLDLGLHYKIVGVGGVMKPQDFFDYRNAGADVVMSATGAMWDPHLARDIAREMTDRLR